MSRAAQSQLLAPMPARVSLPAVQRKAMTDLNSDLAGPAVPRFAQSLSALPVLPKPQRLCAECAAEEEKPRRKPADATLLDHEEDEKSGQGTPVRPSLEVGPANDSYEREADAIAAETLARPAPAAMENPGPVSATSETLSPSAQPLRIRRACASCGAEEETPRARRLPVASRVESGVQRKCAACAEEEKQARKKSRVRTEREGGAPPKLAASPTSLTSGGRPLPATTQDFFESRMGRDLSQVRVHEGSEAGQLNAGIDAHAFTYGSHIWLGQGEKADTGFTMAHELAHVLQQTQPGETKARRRGLETSSAMARVQRLTDKTISAYWLPAGVSAGADARKANEKRHDEAMHALADPDSSIIVDAPIPGATAGSSNRSDRSGFADFYQATPTRTVGVIKASGVPTPEPGKPVKYSGVPLKDFPEPLKDKLPAWITPGPDKKPTKSGSAYDHKAERAPVLNGTDLDKVSDAPKNIKIGDMKPGHNVSEREKGVSQVERYLGTLLNIARIVDTYQTNTGKNTRWGLSGSASGELLPVG